jgi:hypothetical protein
MHDVRDGGVRLRLLLQSGKSRRRLPPLPTFKSGGHVVDITDRDALYQEGLHAGY